MKDGAEYAAWFSILAGAVGLVGSVFTLWLLTSGSIYSIPLVGQLFKALVGLTLYLGIFVVIASLAHIATGLLLRKRRKLGGGLGLALSACEIFGYFSVFIFPSLAVPMVISLALGSAFSLILIAAWGCLS